MKGYKLFDIQSKQIFISCDVVFHEYIFPFHSVNATEDLVDPFPNLVMPSLAFDVLTNNFPILSLQPTQPDISTSGVSLRRSSRATKVPSY